MKTDKITDKIADHLASLAIDADAKDAVIEAIGDAVIEINPNFDRGYFQARCYVRQDL